MPSASRRGGCSGEIARSAGMSRLDGAGRHLDAKGAELGLGLEHRSQ
jgi:hypothetical protein